MDDQLEINAECADEFVKLLMENRHRIYAFIAKQLVNASDTEDVFQKTSLVLWKKVNSYDPNTRFFSWACGVANNEVRNHLTTKRRDRLNFDVELLEILAKESEAEEVESDDRRAALHECIGQLGKPQQELVQSCYLKENSISQVAESKGIKRDALYKKLARLKQKLMMCIRNKLLSREVVHE